MAQTVILIGPPGSGKGTQAQRLARFFAQKSTTQEVLEIDVGKRLRNLTHLSDETRSRIDEDMNAGDLLPTFLSAHLWTDALTKHLSADRHLLLDGSPRRLIEARLLDGALSFYKRTNPVVFHLDIDSSTSFQRLQERNREDDDRSVVEHRLAQFKQETEPVIEYYQNENRYQYEHVDGERSISIIQQDLRARLSR